MEKIKIAAVIFGLIVIVFGWHAFNKNENPETHAPEQSILDVMSEEAGYPVIRDKYGRQIS